MMAALTHTTEEQGRKSNSVTLNQIWDFKLNLAGWEIFI